MSKPTIRPACCSSLWSLEGKLFGLPILASSWTQDLGSLWQCFYAPFETGDWRCGGIVQLGVFSHRQDDTSAHKPGNYWCRSHIYIHISVRFGNRVEIWNWYHRVLGTRRYRFHIHFSYSERISLTVGRILWSVSFQLWPAEVTVNPTYRTLYPLGYRNPTSTSS
jgi:hypothetical protein